MKPCAILAIPFVVLTLAACGGGSSPSTATTSSSSSSTAAAGTSSSSSTSAAKSPSSGPTVHVTMKSLAFSPNTVHAKVGQTVQWINDDNPPHNVTYVSGPKFASSSTLNPGATFHVKLTKPGTIHYFCSIHPFMKATIVVAK